MRVKSCYKANPLIDLERMAMYKAYQVSIVAFTMAEILSGRRGELLVSLLLASEHFALIQNRSLISKG